MPSRRTLVRTTGIAGIALLVVIGLAGAMLVVRSGMRLYYHMQGPPPARARHLTPTEIRGWMTVPYIARAFRVPPDELYRSLGVPAADHRRSSLRTIAKETGRTQDEVIALAQSAVIAYQTAHPSAVPTAPGELGPRPRAPAPDGRSDRSGT